MLVQQGTITFQWEPLETGIEGENLAVERGDATGLAPAPPEGQAGEVPERTPQTLVPGDWITQNQEVRFSYRNAGSDNAVILKAVWAEDMPGGCGGGCK
jgi:hypothetical protein